MVIDIQGQYLLEITAHSTYLESLILWTNSVFIFKKKKSTRYKIQN